MSVAFTGFPPHALDFLAQLALNNNKGWFESNKAEFQPLLMAPLKALVSALSPAMLAIDPEFVVEPAVDRTISRIYRDTRFSRNKAPYKTTLWITFKRRRPDWKETPCYFFELGPDSYRYGMGFYCASKRTMDSLRDEIEYAPKRFQAILDCVAAHPEFALEGERYKRPINPSLSEMQQRWHQQKNIYLVRRVDSVPKLFSPALLEELRSGFTALAPVYEYLWAVRD